MIGELLLNRYKIMLHVGTGGMATVYKAKDNVLNRYVAIKVLLPQFAHDEEFIKKFRREAQAAASLSHSNVVSVYDVGQDDDRHFIVMEYVEGKSLKEVIMEKAPLPVNKAAGYACQISDALIHAHTNNVIHRDIKPHNILITPEEKVKVTDFGIARAVSETTQTYTGSIMGSAHYFSPEQAKGSFTGERSDIYSLGIVMYEMLTGYVPFNGTSPVSIALKHIQENPESPSVYNSEIPIELEKLIMNTLQKDQSYRYQNVKDLKMGLHQFTDKFNDNCTYIENTNGYSNPKPVSPDDSPTQEIPVAETSDYTSKENNAEGNKVTRKKRRTKSKPKVSLKKIIIPLLILGILVVSGVWAVNQVRDFITVPEVTVPDVEGVSLSEAQSILEEQGLSGEVRDEEPHPEISAGNVISQSPESGREVRKNRSIGLIISVGPEYIEVPDVTGMNRRAAELELTQAGFEVKIIEEYAEVSRNQVISQDPPKGDEMQEGDEVEIKVSLGEEPFELPSFIGEDVEDVEEELEYLDLDLRNKHEDEEHSLPKDTVTDQNPDSGEEVQPGDRIDLWVNIKELDEDEEAKEHTIKLDDLPTDETIRIVVDDYLGTHLVFEGELDDEEKEVVGYGSGRVEVLIKDEDDDFRINQIIPFP
ncbi:Stk1 family PASTA domain-containing Ser/Thr kinase [Natranaerobius trueperi]|uniref:non-specific serine/threonine protein kinase n=1 Tax=Natranaerobius trueperi TaxID=759412 RepID=A0A226C1C5_9FIRM|nr:Stk1 family PASTA domain-containing Ser/Thr kinase [Natranaerobius trueperi]OWZ84170.1 serine/threonine protein kinase [Natranaerobius trueperi]